MTEPVKRASAERVAADFEHFLVLTKKSHQPNPTPSDRRRACACGGKGRFYLRRTHRHYSQRPARDSLRPQGVYDWWLVLDDFGLRDLGWESVRFNSRGNHDRPSSRTLRTGPAPRLPTMARFLQRQTWKPSKARELEDVAFTKAHFAVTDMVKSSWVYQRLRRFRCGIEGVISFLKRVFGLDRCTWALIAFF